MQPVNRICIHSAAAAKQQFISRRCHQIERGGRASGLFFIRFSELHIIEI
jgi:hypothetical protein